MKKLSYSCMDVPGQFTLSCSTVSLSRLSRKKDLKTVSKTCLFQHAGKTMSFTQEETDVPSVRSEQQPVQDGTLGCVFVVK